MPAALTYPGVYIEEIPSGVRTITGVATSITAFIGRALRGPTDQDEQSPVVIINSFGDFERIFGGRWVESSLGFAVRDFYLNGGRQAIIVRLYHAESGQNAKGSKTKLVVGALKFEAAYQGAWGQNLRVTLDADVSEAKALSLGLTKADLFNLTVRDAAPGGAAERFANLTVKDSPRRVDNVLKAESKLLRWDGAWVSNPLPAIAAGDDAVTKAEKDLATALKKLEDAQRASPQVLGDIATAQTAVTNAQTALANATKALPDAVSDGVALDIGDLDPPNGQSDTQGMYALEHADLFNLLCIPPYKNDDVDTSLVPKAAKYCEDRRAMLLVDPPSIWKDKATAVTKFKDTATDNVGTRSKNAALFFPRLRQPNPLRDNQPE